MRLGDITPVIWPVIWPFRKSVRSVDRDADDLIELCGSEAYEAAELNSLHEDLGLMGTARPGHWARVAREIARRSGLGDRAPRTDFIV